MKNSFYNLFLSFTIVCFLFCGTLWGQPSNDMPCNAISIPTDGVEYGFNNVDATADDGEEALAPNEGNGSGNDNWYTGEPSPKISKSVWFTFELSGGSIVTISACSGITNFDSQIAVYSAGNCGDYNTFNLLYANDDNSSCSDGNLTSILEEINLDAGTYYLLVDGYDGATGNFSVRIDAVGCGNSDALGFADIFNVSLNEGGSTTAVEGGANVDISLDYIAGGGPDCPSCIRQILIGYESSPIECIYSGIPAVCPESTLGSYSTSITAPTAPGTYNIYRASTLTFSCDDGLAAYTNAGKALIATIQVYSCAEVSGLGFADVINVALNDAGTDIEVEGGSTVNLRFDYVVTNGDECPSCIRQIIR